MREMVEFAQRDTPPNYAVFVGGPKDGERIIIERGRGTVEVAHLERLPRLDDPAPLPVRIIRYQLQRRREGRLFFNRTVRREIGRESLLVLEANNAG